MSVGAGFGELAIEKLKPVEVPPPGVAFVTRTLMLPTVPMSPAGICTTIWPAVIEVGTRPVNVPKLTVAPVAKPVPVIVRLKVPLLTVTPVGLRVLIVGAALLTGNTFDVEVPPPGEMFVTVTLTLPPAAISVAGIWTTTCVGEVDVGTIDANAPNVTVAPGAKPVPVIVNANAAPPAVAFVGDNVLIEGNGLLIVIGEPLEPPPPGTGLTTTTLTFPALAMSVAGICTTICPATIEVGTKPVNVPKFTVAPAAKPLPVIVNANAAPPAVALVGDNVLIEGNGLLIAKGEPLETPPPGAGLTTTTLILPAVTMFVAGIWTTIWPAAIEVGSKPVNVPKFTDAPAAKPAPLIVKANAAPPAVALVGDNVLIEGNGLLIVKGEPLEEPPPGAGLTTTTLIFPALAMSVAGICTTICPAAIEVGTKPANVPKFTDAPAAKPLPVIVNANAAPPAVALVGDNVPIVGNELFTVNV